MHLSVNVDEGWIEAIEFGQVVDGQCADRLAVVSEDLMLVREPDGVTILGFTVLNYPDVDLDAGGRLMFSGPRFCVPALAFEAATIGEVVLAVRGQLTESTADVAAFAAALRALEDEGDLELAAVHWRNCLEAGDMRGHFGLGYTLYELGRTRAAYGHLRRYAALAPRNSWSWLWLGRAADAVGEYEEAAEAYRHAIRREREGSFRTDALVRLRELDARFKRRQRTP